MVARQNKLRVCQIVQDAQGWIGLLRGNEVVARFTSWTDAKRAYQAARKSDEHR